MNINYGNCTTLEKAMDGKITLFCCSMGREDGESSHSGVICVMEDGVVDRMVVLKDRVYKRNGGSQSGGKRRLDGDI